MAAAVALLALLLGGCTGGGSVEELLVAPRLSQNQAPVMEELARAVGGSVKLQYPQQGEYLSPILFRDLDGDGREEAVVFFGSGVGESQSQYVRVAVLGQAEGGWQLRWEEEGLGTEVDSVSFGALFGPDSQALIVGYANTGISEKFLAVYTCEEPGGPLQKVDERSCTEYALADFTGSGVDDLAVVSAATGPDQLQVSLLSVKEGALQPVSSLRLDSLLQSCLALYTSRAGRRYSLVVDGLTSGGTLASEQIYFDPAGGRLASCSGRLGVNLPNLTTRAVNSLLSRDADEDGRVEIPVVLGGVSAFSPDQRMLWVSYYDFYSIDSYQNNFEKEEVQPGRPIESVLPVPPERADSSALPQGQSGDQGAAGGSSAAPSPAGGDPSLPQAAQPAPTAPGAPSAQLPEESPPPAGEGELPEGGAPGVSGGAAGAEAPTNEKVFGLADLSYGYYMRLPLNWKNRVTVERMGARNWGLLDRASGEMLLTVQILGSRETLSGGARFGPAAEYTQVAAVGRYRIFMRVRTGAGIDTAQILGGVSVLG